jgi:glycyl-tRNA synthetase beta chain
VSELLLELFSEEIPARMQGDAARHVRESVTKQLEGKGVARSFVTPRRLTLVIENLPTTLEAKQEERRGPKVGAPEQALAGFLKSTGLAKEQLEERDGYYVAMIRTPAASITTVLLPLLQEMLEKFPWPKSMRWGSGSESWVRPLKNILCLFDGEVLPLKFGALTANNITYGHRFLAPDAITVTNFAGYTQALEKAFVVLDAATRKAKIREQAHALAKAKGGVWREDEGLLEEVTGLVEHPVVLCGNFDKSYLTLPPEVITTTLRSHQKYFVMTAGDSLLPHFLFASNMQANDGGAAIIEGNERVLKARLSDARFFYELDLKTPLEAMNTKLSGIIFHAKLGTIAEKVARVQALAELLAPYIPGCDKAQAAEAASLCKADLVSGMVGEFPELQGLMGYYYAIAQVKERTLAVAEAIRDHYAPQGPADRCPTAPVSVAVALADKLDTLLVMRSMEETLPTGSKDPFAVRRAMLGFNRIVEQNKLRIPLNVLSKDIFTPLTQGRFDKVKDLYIKRSDIKDSGKLVFTVDNFTVEDDFTPFAKDRLKVMLKDQNIRHDVVTAVMGGDDDLVRIVARAHALQAFLSTPEGENLLAGYRRAANILKAEEKKDNHRYNGAIEPQYFENEQEKQLLGALEVLRPTLVPLVKNEDFTGVMQKLSGLRAPLDGFFAEVMVNAPDADIRRNRLNLLGAVRDLVEQVADFGAIEG